MKIGRSCGETAIQYIENSLMVLYGCFVGSSIYQYYDYKKIPLVYMKCNLLRGI